MWCIFNVIYSKSCGYDIMCCNETIEIFNYCVYAAVIINEGIVMCAYILWRKHRYRFGKSQRNNLQLQISWIELIT